MEINNKSGSELFSVSNLSSFFLKFLITLVLLPALVTGTFAELKTSKLSSVKSANDKVIYGEDDRVELENYSDENMITLGRSTAVMLSRSSLSVNRNTQLATVKGKNLVSGAGVCSEEPFSDQLAPGRCSGFLVAPDLLVTAGHCVTGALDCSNYSWVFDFKMHPDHPEKNYTVPASSIYNCAEIIERKLDNVTMDDYALIRLSARVADRSPLQFRKSGKIQDDAKLVVIGHPSGLPTKVADGARVRTNTNSYYFVPDLDTYGGNSGSAVFNADDGVVEGILVRGENDFDYIPGKLCRLSKRCAQDDCRGEDVTRITNIKALTAQSPPEVE